MNDEPAIQDQMLGNGCFGCGPGNARGLQIKSYWRGDRTVCSYQPEPHMVAGPPQWVNGGIIATVIDCHSVCTAVASAYRDAGRPIGEGKLLWYATGKLGVSYKQPVPMDAPMELSAVVTESTDKKKVVECEVRSKGQLCCTGTVVAVRVPEKWVTPPTS